MNGADILCDTLLANGVDMCFANPGTSEMHFVAALDRKPAMRCVLGLFEGVVTGAADGYARMADKPAAALLHLGPGLANGLANLHNARRAGTPVLNIVGEHASYHRAYDAPLTSDIEGLARPMSCWVRTIAGTAEVSRDAAAAIAATAPNGRTPEGPGGHVATLILPADAAWGELDGEQAATLAIAKAGAAEALPPAPERVREAVTRLRRPGRALLLLAGKALRATSLEIAARIAQASGARLLAQQSNARIERGAGRVAIERVLYNVDAALTDLAEIEQVILVGAKAPVAFFAYPGKPGSVLPPECQVFCYASPEDDAALALEALAEGMSLSAVAGHESRAMLSAPWLPERPTGVLAPAAIMALVGRLMPEYSIVCDEAITSGHTFFKYTWGAAPHDFLQLTGGAIGEGMPLGTGAALACPERKVICLQADGSGMYTLQALWTQARERLDVVTVIFANRSYAILRGELKQVGAGEAGRNAGRMLDLVDPALDWVKLAAGMGVEATRVDSIAGFEAAFSSAMGRRGPFLIEALI